MLETISMLLLIVWAIGLAAGVSLGGAFHLLLVASGVILWVERSSRSRARSDSTLTFERAMLPWRRDGSLKGRIPQAPGKRALSPGVKVTAP